MAPRTKEDSSANTTLVVTDEASHMCPKNTLKSTPSEGRLPEIEKDDACD